MCFVRCLFIRCSQDVNFFVIFDDKDTKSWVSGVNIIPDSYSINEFIELVCNKFLHSLILHRFSYVRVDLLKRESIISLGRKDFC